MLPLILLSPLFKRDERSISRSTNSEEADMLFSRHMSQLLYPDYNVHKARIAKIVQII